MKIIVDLDGVICTEEKTFERSLAIPIPGAIESINQLKQNGHDIVIYTARSWSEETMTKAWLDFYDVNYDTLILGKPTCDFYIDDRAIRFNNWDRTNYLLDKKDDYNLYILRLETKKFIENLAKRNDILSPILEIGPHNKNSNVFKKMPETFVLAEAEFAKNGYNEFLTMDIDESTDCDVVGDITNLDPIEFPDNSVGTIICNSVFEHVPNVWEIPKQLHRVLKQDGKAFCLSPWALRLHGPRPDCWRISDDGFDALFGDLFDLKIEKIGEDPLNPVAFVVEMKKRQ